MGRAPCCAKVGLHRGPWTPKEDSLLINYINTHGEGQWRSLPKKAGLLRCGKSCRLRWMNYLRPDIKRGNITPDEDDLIIRLHALLGNRWSLIAGRLPGRTDNEIKNYWNTHLSKKLRTQGIDPDTHKNLPLISTNHDHTDTDEVVIDPVKQHKFKKTKSKSKKSSEMTIVKKNKKKKNTKQSASNSTTTTKEEPTTTTTTIIKTKVHLPKAVRLTSPLSISSLLTRNSSNASFDSNFTSCLTTTSTGVVPTDYPWPPPTSDHHHLNDHLQTMIPTGCDDTDYVTTDDAAPSGEEVRFLIGSENDDDGNHHHHGKFEKLYDEYLQLIKVGDHHHHHHHYHDDDEDDRINNSNDFGDFSYGSGGGNHEFDLFADSLLI